MRINCKKLQCHFFVQYVDLFFSFLSTQTLSRAVEDAKNTMLDKVNELKEKIHAMELTEAQLRELLKQHKKPNRTLCPLFFCAEALICHSLTANPENEESLEYRPQTRRVADRLADKDAEMQKVISEHTT